MKATSQLHRQTNVNTFTMRWARRYFVSVGLVALGCAGWKYDLFIHTPLRGGWNGFQTWEVLMDCCSYFFSVVLLLVPWWRRGDLIPALGYTIALPACTYVIAGLSVVNLLYTHQQTVFQIFLLSGVLTQILWLFLRLRAESRKATIAFVWKQRLRQNHHDKIELVEKFILENEGEEQDITQWNKYSETSRKDDPMAMWKGLDAEWVRWLNP